MKYLNIQNISVLVFCLLCYACKKVINVNLNSSAPQVVIQGEVNNLSGPYTVTISTSVNYTADNTYPGLSGALVTITGNGIKDTLTETAPGVYITNLLQGTPGASYSLYVAVQGETFTANSVMPQQVWLDSIGFKSQQPDNTLNAVAYFQDPAAVKNYYQFIETMHGKQFNNNRGWSVFEDRLSDGRYISNTLLDDSTDIKPGDTLSVQMNCIDENVYNYLFTLSQITGTGGNSFSAPTPSNPLSNISNNALGYFSANTKQIKTVIVHK